MLSNDDFRNDCDSFNNENDESKKNNEGYATKMS